MAIEDIPDSAKLYKYIHVTLINNGVFSPSAFKQTDMSVNWDKYISAERTRLLSADPAKNGVIRLIAGDVRKIDDLTVDHAPSKRTKAHSEVRGPKPTKIRVALRRISKMIIPVGGKK